MRLLHVINSVNPAGGGAIEAVRQSARALEPLGHEVEIVCLDAPDSPWLAEMEAPTHALGPAVTPYRYARGFTDWMRENARHYDSFILNGVWEFANHGAARVLRKADIPYFLYPHGSLDATLRTTFPVRHLKKMAMWALTERQVVDGAAAVFYTTELEKQLAEKTFWPRLQSDNGFVVPYCVGEPPTQAERQRRAFSAAFPHLDGREFCLFLSRVHPKKGCDLLIHAFGEIQRSRPDLELVMAGPEEDPAYARELMRIAKRHGVADRITWAGMLRGDLKWGALRSANIFALPTHQENFGIAIVEALACGSPVVISDKTNLAPVVERHAAGIVGTDSVHSTVESLQRWFSLSRDAQQTMRRNARRCFDESFSAAENAKRLLSATADGLAAAAVRSLGQTEGFPGTLAAHS